MKDRNPSPQEFIRTSGKNRGWIYRSIKKLHEEGLIYFCEGKSFEAGKLYMTLYSSDILRRINKDLAERFLIGIALN